jgi:predicted amidohydrolase
MKNNLKVTLIQTPLVWEDVTANIRNLQKKIQDMKRGSTDLIVLPEMFSTGFSMRPEIFAEKEGGSAMQWMAETARELRCVVTGSLMLREGKKYYNRMIWMRPDGSYGTYNKRHLFRMGNEGETYTQGKKQELFEVNGFSICPQICYDLRFPVWSRNSLKVSGKSNTYKYDVLLYVANWPAVRQYPWQQLLLARAIENQCYVVGVNRIGKDANDAEHSGGSCVIDAYGKVLFSAGKKAVSETVVIDLKSLQEFRKKFPVLLDADNFTIN